MKLAIIKADGTIEVVTEDIQDYDLWKNTARALIMDDVARHADKIALESGMDEPL